MSQHNQTQQQHNQTPDQIRKGWVYVAVSFLVSVILTLGVRGTFVLKGDFTLTKFGDETLFSAFTLESISIAISVALSAAVNHSLRVRNKVTDTQRNLINLNIVFSSSLIVFFLLHLLFNFGKGMVG